MSDYTPKRLPIGIQTFEKLREEGWFYVDKTELVYQLVTGGAFYFLSRPRRFGKSLLLSTLRSFWEGKRELFEGLTIMQHEELKWEAHPVLYLDLNTQKYDKPESLSYVLDKFLSENERKYGVLSDKSEYFGPRFETLIASACEKTGKRVVILVDEYDKPLLQAIGNTALQDAYRATLKGFYGALKSMDAYIQFAFLTGVTKFGKVSVFSDLNNLNDISMDSRYYDICGITEKELLSYFEDDITHLAEQNDMTREECVEALRKRYDGYCFHPEAPRMYNPSCILSIFGHMDFISYWFETSTLSSLMELLQRLDYNLEKMSHAKYDATTLNFTGAESQDPIPVMYQTGYLTIKDYNPRFNLYTLGFPNEDMEEGFVKYLMSKYFYPKGKNDSFFDVIRFVKDVRNGQTESFIKRLRSLFADTPYEIIKNLENHYQNVLWILYKLMGFYTQAEYHTCEGRIDLVVKTPKYVYVMEFKLDGTAEEALEQIDAKHYTLPFEVEDRQVIRIGMNFSKETRNIERHVVAVDD